MRIKNIIFDIGNVILHFDLEKVLSHFAKTEAERNFLIQEVVHSPEWFFILFSGYWFSF